MFPIIYLLWFERITMDFQKSRSQNNVNLEQYFIGRTYEYILMVWKVLFNSNKYSMINLLNLAN